MVGRFFKLATVAGLLGLAVLHADDVASIASKTFALFPAAIGLSNGKAKT